MQRQESSPVLEDNPYVFFSCSTIKLCSHSTSPPRRQVTYQPCPHSPRHNVSPFLVLIRIRGRISYPLHL
jgi:hypothetical protein